MTNQGSVAVLELPNSSICLQRREDSAPNNAGMLTLFGGHLEGDETPLDCMERELLEEISLIVDGKSINHLFDHTATIAGRIVTLHCFLVKVPLDDFEVYEGAGTETYTVDEILSRNDVVEVDRDIIQRYAEL